MRVPKRGQVAPTPSYQGVLPQLAAGAILLLENRSNLGLWVDDPWVTAKVLEALVSYRSKVEALWQDSNLLTDSASALLRWLSEEAEEVANAADLYPGLDGRLRAMCASYAILDTFEDKSIRDGLVGIRPALLKLFDAGAEYAGAMQDLVVASDVLCCLNATVAPAEAANLAEPWLVNATRVLLGFGSTADGIRALNLLLKRRETALHAVVKTVWAAEAPRMTPKGADVPFDDALRERAAAVLGAFQPSTLDDACLVVDTYVALTGNASRVSPTLWRELVRLLADEVASFRTLGRQAAAISLVSIASAVRILSESGMGEVLTFREEDEPRVTRSLSVAARVESGRARVVSKTKYTALQAVALGSIYLWAATFGLFNPGLVWLAGLLAAAATGIVLLVFRPEG